MNEMHYGEFDSLFLLQSLEIDKHINGYVDSYYGPKQIKQKTDSTPPLPSDQLIENQKHLMDIVPTADAKRLKYLRALLNAMECAIGKLQGVEYEYNRRNQPPFWRFTKDRG